jgi:hypothetical protein
MAHNDSVMRLQSGTSQGLSLRLRLSPQIDAVVLVKYNMHFNLILKLQLQGFRALF